MEYTVEYYISKFEAIPEEEWAIGYCTDSLGRHCAIGHCGGVQGNVYLTLESEGLDAILPNAVQINDNSYNHYSDPTPKKRILAALYDIRDKELSQANVREVEKIINTVGEPLNV